MNRTFDLRRYLESFDPRRLWRDASRSARVFVLSFLLLAIPRAIELSPIGDWVESQSYSALTSLLTKRANVVIVDISDLQPVDGITPRASLEELVVALRKAGAEAVAIDIDFSPDHNMFVGQNDPEVFERWRQSPMPVILGVERAAGGPPEAWLGKPEFSRLAGGIVVPYQTDKPAERGALPGQYPVYIPGLDRSARDERRGAHLPTLAVALAAIERKQVAQTLLARDRRIDLFTVSIAEQSLGDDDGPKIPQFAVNYRSADRLEATAIPSKWQNGHLSTTNDWRTVRGNLVLVGDVQSPSAGDRFPMPGGRQVSGVVHHAMATTTLLTQPLRAFGPWTRAAVDIACTAFAIAFVALWEERQRRPSRSSRRTHDYLISPLLKSVALLLAISFLSVIAASFWSVLWIDCLLVALVGLLDAFTEHPKEAVQKVGV